MATVTKKVKKSYKVTGNARQKLAIKKVLESKGKSVSKAMREAGYPATTAKNPKQLTESKAWNQIIDEIIPESFVAEQHKKLFNAKRLDYFVFAKSLEDQDIKDHMKASGLTCIVIRPSDKGKMAFYSIADSQAIKGAIDMALKMRGKYIDKLDVNNPDGNLKTIIINKSKK